MGNLYKSMILLMIFSLSGASAWAAGARIEALAGAGVVSVKRAGKDLKLKEGDQVEAGDELTTDRHTAVDLRFDDKSLIRVGANSSYRMEEEKTGLWHHLLSGIVRVLVPPTPHSKEGAVRFRLSTPEGTIGVRGTEFVVIRSKGETTLKGLEGEVMFGPSGADFSQETSFVFVKRGYESSVKAGGKPTAAKTFPLSSYLKGIDAQGGVFGALASRKGTPVKTRSPVIAKNPGPAPKAVPSLKGKEKSVTVSKKKEEAKEVDWDEKLFLAASNGDLATAKTALKKGAEINSRHIDDNTPLHAAAVESQMDMVKWLIQNGADVNAKNKYGYTPLMVVAFESGSAEIATVLLDNGAHLKEKDPKGITALDLAKAGFEKNKETWGQIYQLLQEEWKK
jgi:hypothetical protein